MKLAHYYQSLPGFFDFQDVYTKAVQEAPKNGVLVEVGAWLGKSLAFIATEMVNQDRLDLRLCSVDHIATHAFPKNYPDKMGQLALARKLGYEGMSGILSLKKALQPCLELGLQWDHDIINSALGSRRFHDETVDFVFLDASHDYHGILAELLGWWPKVKPGGILAGHDHTDDFPGVIQGVREFFCGKARPVSKSSFSIRKDPSDTRTGPIFPSF